MFFWSGRASNKEFESHIESMVNSGGRLLDVGCGRAPIKGCIGIDPYEPGVDISAYMWNLPFGDNSVDGIACMSALEHISKFQVLPTLNEFNRVLKVGAPLIIVVPDLLYCIAQFQKNPNVFWEMDLIFGMQEHNNEIHDGEFHKTGFTRDIIQYYFKEFPSLKIKHIYDVEAYQQMNLGIIAVKE